MKSDTKILIWYRTERKGWVEGWKGVVGGKLCVQQVTATPTPFSPNPHPSPELSPGSFHIDLVTCARIPQFHIYTLPSLCLPISPPPQATSLSVNHPRGCTTGVWGRIDHREDKIYPRGVVLLGYWIKHARGPRVLIYDPCPPVYDPLQIREPQYLIPSICRGCCLAQKFNSIKRYTWSHRMAIVSRWENLTCFLSI